MKRRVSFLVMAGLFSIEALYGMWSLRVWRILGQMGSIHHDIQVPFFHPYVVWYRIGRWYASVSGGHDLAAVMGTLINTMWTMVIGGLLCAVLFFVLAIPGRSTDPAGR